jgi:CheY-like chemotaxis protein
VHPAETRRRWHGTRLARRVSDGPSGGGQAPSHRVLIVDDEASIRLICNINFSASGWACMEAADGREALERIRESRPDVVLLDVMMPRLDGWEVAEELAGDAGTRDLPIVFLTARAEPRDRERAHALGAVGYLTKPLDPVDLPNRLDEILRRLARGEREQLRAAVLERRDT